MLYTTHLYSWLVVSVKADWSPSVLGDYEVSIRFNDEHIPDSPFVVPVASPSDDARRLTVASLQVRLRERQTFVHPKQLRVNPWHSSCNDNKNRTMT